MRGTVPLGYTNGPAGMLLHPHAGRGSPQHPTHTADAGRLDASPCRDTVPHPTIKPAFVDLKQNDHHQALTRMATKHLTACGARTPRPPLREGEKLPFSQ